MKVLLFDISIDVLAINETRLDSTISDNEMHVPGYEIVRRDRNVNGRLGGGVCFYVRCNINYSPRLDLSIDQIENLCIEIRKPKCKPFLVATWYRPPDSLISTFNCFETLVGRIDAENIEYYLMGDLNCDLSSKELDHNSTKLMNIADLYNLHQVINEPTRITISSSTMIDLIFTNTVDKIVCSGVSHVGISDHSLVYAFRKLSTGLSTIGHTTVTYRNFEHFDSECFRNDICSQNWDDINNYDNPNEMWRVWKNIFNNVVDRHAPLRSKRVRATKSPWVTKRLKQLMHQRDSLKLKAIRSNDPNVWLDFKKKRNTVNKSKHSNEGIRSYSEYLTCCQNRATLQLKETKPSIVFSLLSKLSVSKATGLDKISAKLLRVCPDLIADSLCSIFNRSINTGIFPEEWKCSKVVPLFKEGDRKDLNNYRPISIIPVVAKVFERIIHDQVNTFLVDNGLLSNSQSGFRHRHSTTTALLEATNEWAYNIDSGNVNAVVFLDLKKAFDTVDHGILLSKLHAYGIQGVASDWLKSYLSNRMQKCSVNGFLSHNQTLQCGVPQGTILGPLLFLIYINDLPNCLAHSKTRMYADDTNLSFAGNNVLDIEQNLNQDLENVNEWLIANKLTLNQSKTEFMLIGSRQRIRTFETSPSLETGGMPINRVSHTKSIGVYLDENLTWNEHINQISRKIASGIGALKRIRSFVPDTTLQFIFNSLVQPYFDYCCVVWDNCSKTLADKLEKLQNRAARMLTFSSYDANADVVLASINWKKLETQRKIQKAVMVHKSLYGLAPDYLRSMFVNRSIVANYSLRDTEGKLAIPKPRTDYLRNSFSYSGAVLWNSLPTDLRQTENPNQFKAGCINFFTNEL